MPVDDGIYYPVITPFDADGDVDHDTFADLLEFGIEKGMHGVFALGSAGQGPTLDAEEHKRAVETAVETVDGRVPLIAHVGTASTTTSVDLARHADAQGVDMIALVPPYYYSDHSWGEIVGHFGRVAESTDAPLLLYNNPKYAGIAIGPDRLADLVDEVPQIQGIKASFNPLSDLVEYVHRTPEGFKVFAGAIWYLLSGVHYGVAGSIHPPTSVFPEPALRYWEHIQDGQLDRALEYQAQMFDYNRAIAPFRERYGRATFVELFSLRGIDIETYPRWETVPIEDGVAEELVQALEDAGMGEYLD